MKKFLCLALLSFLLVGCGRVVDNEPVIKNEPKKEIYSLVSSEDRLVFQKENNYEIVYYEGSKIVNVEVAIKFATEKEAKRHYEEEKYGSSHVIKYIDNVYIVEESEDYWEDYKGLSKEKLKDYFNKADYNFIQGDD